MFCGEFVYRVINVISAFKLLFDPYFWIGEMRRRLPIFVVAIFGLKLGAETFKNNQNLRGSLQEHPLVFTRF